MDAQVSQLEAKVLFPPGAVRQLEERVEKLELSQGATAIDMGGVVFPDEEAVELWVRKLGEPDAHRFALDMFSLFLLSDPKYVTIGQGLQQTAAAVKAQFSSIDLATIDLSYGMGYPPAMLRSSEKPEAQCTDGIVWGPAYAMHDIFMGEYNNGTHQRTK